MKKAAIIALAVLISMGTVVGVGYAIGRGFCKMSPEQKADRIAARITKELDLTAEQKAKLDAMKAEVLDRITQLHQDREANRAEVLSLVKKDRITEADINALIEKRESKWRELKPFLVDTIVDFHRMLTPEQRNKLAEKMESFHKGCGHHFE